MIWTVYIGWKIERALYVGRTNNLPRRMRWHRYGSKWFNEMTRFDTMEFQDEAVAKVVEAERVAALEPIYNRVNPTGLRTTDPRLYGQQYRAAHREKILARQRAWRAANKEKARENQQKRDERWFARYRAELAASQETAATAAQAAAQGSLEIERPEKPK